MTYQLSQGLLFQPAKNALPQQNDSLFLNAYFGCCKRIEIRTKKMRFVNVTAYFISNVT